MPYLIAFLITELVTVVAWWRILDRIGWPPILAVLMAIPLVNIAAIVYVALTPWPIEQRFQSLQSDLKRMRGEL